MKNRILLVSSFCLLIVTSFSLESTNSVYASEETEPPPSFLEVTHTPTEDPAFIPTETETPIEVQPTNTEAPTLAGTPTQTVTMNPTNTASVIFTYTQTLTSTASPTLTSTATPTSTKTSTATPTTTPGLFEVYGLPWPEGAAWLYLQGPHGGTQNALDFATPSRRAETVYVAFTGKLTYASETCLAITRSDGLVMWYQHIVAADVKKIRANYLNRTITQGTPLGKTTLSPGSTHHVHIYFEINGRPVNVSLNGWKLAGSLNTTTLLRRAWDGREASPISDDPVLYCAVPKPSQLLIPESGKLVNRTNSKLDWKQIDCVKYYVLQISLNSRMVPTVTENKVVGSAYTTSNLIDGTYYWWVRGVGYNDEFGPWSTKASFTVDTVPPGSPALSSPVSNTTSIGAPSHTWQPVIGASSYVLQYIDLATQQVITFEATNQTTLKPSFIKTGDFLWQVKACDLAGNCSNFSASRRLTIKPAIPGIPTLISPANKYSTTDTTPTLKWNAVNYGFSYEVWISRSASSTTANLVPVAERVVEGRIQYTMTIPLPKGTYYWRVRAINSEGQIGPWASYFSLQIK